MQIAFQNKIGKTFREAISVPVLDQDQAICDADIVRMTNDLKRMVSSSILRTFWTISRFELSPLTKVSISDFPQKHRHPS